MTLRLKGSNSGDVSIAAPATAGDNTITLPTSNGSANQYLKNGSTAGTLEFGTLPTRVNRTYGSQVTYTDGDAAIEFTGIPANFSRLRLVMRGLSLSGSDHIQLQIGHAASGGTYLTSTYDSMSNTLGLSGVNGTTSSSSFVIRSGGSGNAFSGFIELYPDLETSPKRLYSNHAMMNTGGTGTRFGAGRGPAVGSVTIDRIKLIPTGSNTFDGQNSAFLSLITEVIE
jgi:hypothetical protein